MGKHIHKMQDRTQRKIWYPDLELELLRHSCREDFWTFFLHAFGAAHNPKGKRWIDPEVHRPLADWFQFHINDWTAKREAGEGEQKHLAVIVQREVGKTTLITQAGQAWLHVRDPELSSYTGSEKTEHAMASLQSIKAIMEGSDPYAMFPKLYGDWSTSARKWSGREIVHAARKNTARRDPSLGTFAVETSIVGAHPDAIFYDDPISYERLLSDANWLESVNSQVTSLYPVIQSDGLIVWVGTRYDDDDHFGIALRPTDVGGDGICSLEGMSTDAFKVEPKEGQWHVYFMAGRDHNGKPTTPKVWPENRLRSYQRRDPLRYAAQIMNDPAVSEFNPLTKEQILQCVVPSDQIPWHSLLFYFCCDTAFWDGKSRAKKDDTVVVCQGIAKNGSGDVYLVEAHGSPTWRGEDFKKKLVVLAQRYRSLGRRIGGIVDEDPHGGKRGSWKSDLRNAFNDMGEPMPPYIELPRSSAGYNYGSMGTPQKIRRMIGASHFWVDGHVRVLKDAPGVDRVMEQMGKIGQYMVNPKLHNDWADAHSMIFENQIYQPMRRPASKAMYGEGAVPIDRRFATRKFTDDDWDSENPRPPIR